MKAFSYILLLLQLALISGFWGWNHVNHIMGNQLTGPIAGQLLAYGRLTGLMAAFGALLQILLIGRTQWIERAFGFDRLARLHHIVGFALLSTLIAHPVLVLLGHAAQAGVSLRDQYVDFLRSWDDVAAASAGLILMLAAIVFSVAVLLRKMRYENWYATHLLFYVAIALAFGHQLSVGSDFTMGSGWFKMYWVALYSFVGLNLAWYRVARPLVGYARHRFKVAAVRPETGDVNSVFIEGINLSAFPIRAGQFLSVRFLAPGFRWEAHPFSVSRIADGRDIRLSIKALGDFTRRIPQLKPGTPVLVDGPHGIFTAKRCANPKLLLIAGGIGITPIRAIVEELAKQGRDMVLVYANRSRKHVAFWDELERLVAGSGRLRVVHVMSDDPDWTGEKGKVDRALIERAVPDARERDVFLCGPPPMMKMVRRALGELGVSSGRIHWERFAL